jgi:NAD(P)-dependent dehydrogenase (short-subunit alcohol dehydrogenase family)
VRGEVVLITGGSSGIGLAAARLFLARGARVWLTARDEGKLGQAVEGLGPGADFASADVTDPASLDRLVARIGERDGRLDVLLNSAGQLQLGNVSESAPEMAERLMRVNYIGTARVVAATLPLLRQGSRRSIVNLSSFVGRIAPPFWSAYAATKHAVQAYTHSLRQELRPEKFHVGLVLPGPVESPMTDGLLRTPYYPIPIGVPVIQTEQVADAIVGCVLRRRREVTVPGRFGPLLRLGSAFPRLVDLLYLPYRPR